MPEVTIRLRHDPWLDNGLEVLGALLEKVARQHPQVLDLTWEPEALALRAHDPQRLVALLDEEVRGHAETYLYYTGQRKDGTTYRQLKGFIGFNQQPPGQWPELYQDEKRRPLLCDALGLGDAGRAGAPCPVCGQAIRGGARTLTLSVYPMVTKNKAFSGARTRWAEEGFTGRPTNASVCAQCYLLGALAWADPALLYLCDLGRERDTAVAIVPAPPRPDLRALHVQKGEYKEHLRAQERRTNVRFRPPPRGQEPQEEQEVREGRHALLLAFLERALWEVAQREPLGWDELFQAARHTIPQGWLFITIPQGRMKNVTVHDLVLDEPTLALLARLVEGGVLPYAEAISQLWWADDKGRPVDATSQNEVREAMAQALLTDRFGEFALPFLPRPRRQLRVWPRVAEKVEAMVQKWRWREMDEKTLETVRKAGYALAEIAASRRQPVILYELERVRTRSDLLNVLREAVHRLIGLPDVQYVSFAALEELIQMLGRDEVPFDDLKNTLFIFAGIAYARKSAMQGRGEQEGGA